MTNPSRSWYQRIPHPVVMLFGIIVLMTSLSYVIPAGQYERVEVDGRMRVVPGSYHAVEATPVGLLDMFKAIPLGYKTAAEIIFVVLASGIMFGVLEKAGTIETSVGTLIKRLGQEKKFLIVVLLTFLYGFFGVAIGYENNIALVPIAAVVILALGGDLVLAAGVSVGGITVGFGLSPINPYTVGTGHKIAELALFSGAVLRTTLCLVGLGLLAWYNVRYFRRILQDRSRSLGQGLDEQGLKLSRPLASYQMDSQQWLILGLAVAGIIVMLSGIFIAGWYINEISALFLMIAIVCGVASRMDWRTLSETALKSIGEVAPGAFMVGYATSIKVVMEMGNISDTIAHSLAGLLASLPTYVSAVSMALAQSVINLLIPSGSGQALATLPVMIPVGELVGLTRQTTILAFQIGDGVTNLFNPALGGLIAMLAFCRVPFDRWLRYIMPLVGWLLLIAAGFLVFSVAIDWQ
ncbi:MAG: AbgT family transporter [Bacteroidota bacterium]